MPSSPSRTAPRLAFHPFILSPPSCSLPLPSPPQPRPLALRPFRFSWAGAGAGAACPLFPFGPTRAPTPGVFAAVAHREAASKVGKMGGNMFPPTRLLASWSRAETRSRRDNTAPAPAPSSVGSVAGPALLIAVADP